MKGKFYLTKEQQDLANKLKGFGLGLIINAVVIMIFIFVIVPKVKIQAKAELFRDKSYSLVYVADKAFKEGEKLNYNDLKPRTVPENIIPKGALNLICNNKFTRTSIEKNTIITGNMLIDKNGLFKSDERAKDYKIATGLIGNTVNPGDYIDVEYVKANGDTYTVLSKKKVYYKLDQQTVVIHVTMAEQKTINKAISDTAKNSGDNLEVSLYLDESQSPSKITYPQTEVNSSEERSTGVQQVNTLNMKGRERK